MHSNGFLVQTYEFGGRTLSVGCRNNLTGDDSDEDAVDPHLFDEDYNPAVSTGFTKERPAIGM
jgi:hypothetical protein